ncbi:MAG: hypothetical protein ACK4YF_09165, partial [Exilispira sp.]
MDKKKLINCSNLIKKIKIISKVRNFIIIHLLLITLTMGIFDIFIYSKIKNIPGIPEQVLIYKLIIYPLFLIIAVIAIILLNKLYRILNNFINEFSSIVKNKIHFIINHTIFGKNLITDKISNEFSKALKEEIGILSTDKESFNIDNISECFTNINLLEALFNIIMKELIEKDKLLTEKDNIINQFIFSLESLKPIYYSNVLLKIFPYWQDIIENKINSNISRLSIGIESFKKLSLEFDSKIENIES